MLAIDGGRHQVFVDGKTVHLTYIEWKLMQYFIAHPNRAIRKERIFEEVWGMPPMQIESTLRTHMSRLRKKTGIEITPVPYVGYRYDMDDCDACPCCGRAMIEAD